MGRRELMNILSLLIFYRKDIIMNINHEERIEADKLMNSMIYCKEFWEYNKSKCFPRILNIYENEDMLMKSPHFTFENLAMSFYIQLRDCIKDGKTKESVLLNVNHKMLNSWGISLNELNDIAIENLITQRPPIFGNIMSAILQIKKLPELVPENIEKLKAELLNNIPLYIVTNAYNGYGAVYMLIPKVLKCIKKVLESNFIILPSSVHEILILKEYDSPCKYESLLHIVKDVNSKHVAKYDKLADSVYRYSDTGLEKVL